MTAPARTPDADPAKSPVREVWRAAWPLLLSQGMLLAVWDLGARPVGTFIVLSLAFLAGWRGWRILQDRRRLPWSWVLVVAALLRVMLLPLPPTLSDDLLRYVWDGRVVLAGFDPYRSAPEAEELEGLRDELWQRMPHKEVPAVYPPLALGVFALAAATPEPLLGVKILLVMADLLGCLLLIRLAERLGLPPARSLLYAWNPLVALEVGGMGHVDALLAALALASAWALLRRRPVMAGLAAAGAVLAKIVPVVALPLWTLLARRRALFAGVALGALLLGTAPVILGVGLPPGLVAYGVRWEFDGPLYEPLWRVVDATPAVETIKSGLDALKDATGDHERWNRVYPLVYPQLLAKLLLAAGFGVYFLRLLWLARRRRGDPGAVPGLTGRLFAGVLLAMATVYPWYLLWVLPWAALARHRAWLLASALQILAYLPQHVDGLELFPWFWLLIWGPVLAWLPFESWDEGERADPTDTTEDNA